MLMAILMAIEYDSQKEKKQPEVFQSNRSSMGLYHLRINHLPISNRIDTIGSNEFKSEYTIGIRELYS